MFSSNAAFAGIANLGMNKPKKVIEATSAYLDDNAIGKGMVESDIVHLTNETKENCAVVSNVVNQKSLANRQGIYGIVDVPIAAQSSSVRNRRTMQAHIIRHGHVNIRVEKKHIKKTIPFNAQLYWTLVNRKGDRITDTGLVGNEEGHYRLTTDVIPGHEIATCTESKKEDSEWVFCHMSVS